VSVALEGITVLDLTQGVSGPFATRLLSQMGARVVKVERPGGGDIVRFWDDIVLGMCSGHAWVNPGKESLALDLGTADGQGILLSLVEKSDVVIENFVPGTLEKWGLTYDLLRARNPKVIFCRISGFGQDGPYRDRAALDLIVQGEAGLISTNGTEEHPAKLSLSVCDISGSMYATIAILEALYHRERTGDGQRIEIALLDSVLTWTGYFPYMHWYKGELPKRVGLHHHTMTPYGPYVAKDGLAVILAAGSGHRAMWERFCNAIARPDIVDHPDFASNALRMAHRAEVDAVVSTAIAQHDRAYWLARFHEFGIPAGALNDLAQALDHPRVASRGFVKEVPSAVGPVKVFDFPPQFSELESVNKLGPPALGEHTASILKELDLSADRIAELERRGVVECAPGG
jgi:itaconate CoA-transferase